MADIDIRDIQLPSDLLWWPPTPLSWLTLCATISLVGVLVWLFFRYRKKRVLYFSLRNLEKLFKRYQSDYDASGFARDISVLLKRIYMTVGNRAVVAGLSGKKWLTVLDEGLDDEPFTKGIGQILVSAPYQKTADFDVQLLYVLCRKRIESLQVN
ncbi:hypothetical protein MNBD_GAMMA12-2760 [hydrothermal vent metagenome]|uniref:DUF4381 domain-containing protein n=1 Tax=hydrothermal vent metagenome TaxID=652676 RepID=A0A3B0YFN8_9ZZZZ